MSHTNVIAEMLLADPTPMIIWAVLIVLTVPAMLLLGNQHRLHDPRQAVHDIVTTLRAQRRRTAAAVRPEVVARTQAVEAARFANEIRVCTQRAQAAATQWQQRLEQAEQDHLTAWQAWLDADSRLRNSMAAAAFTQPWSARTCEEYAARERFLHRTVIAAAQAGDLPTTAVADALAGRNGWDPRRHPLNQQLAIHRAAAQHRRHRYEQAATTEKTTAHQAELSRHAAASLHHTSTQAAHREQPRNRVVPAQGPSPAMGSTRLRTA